MKSPLDSHSEAPPSLPPPPPSAVPSAAPSQHASASRVCGVSIIHLSSRARLALISFSFVVVWIAHDVLQELITKTPGLPRIGLVLTASELLACILLPWLVSQRAAAADGAVPFAFVHALTDFIRMALRLILRVLCSGGGAEERACVASTLAALRLRTESSAPASAWPAPAADGQASAAVSIAVPGHPSCATDDGSALPSSSQAAASTELDFHFSHLLTKPLPADASLRLHRAIWAGRLAVAAVLLLVSIATAVSSLAHVGFPLKVAFKSSKLIPTMLIGVLLLGKRFSSAQAAAAVMLCFGLIGFTLADKDQTESSSPLPVDSAASPSSSSSAASATTGVVMLTVSVLLDATIPNFYERLFTPTAGTFGTQRAPATDFVMMWVNLVALVTLAPALVVTGQLADALAYFAQPANWHLALVLLVFALLSYAGISCMLLLTSEAGGIFSTALATARKAVTIALSFVLFPGKRFTPLVACAGALVLGGIALGATASKHGGGAHGSAPAHLPSPASSSDAGHATAAEKSPLTGVASQ